MIIPISNGSTITTIYIPEPDTTTYPVVSQQSDTNIQNNDPTFLTSVGLGDSL